MQTKPSNPPLCAALRLGSATLARLHQALQQCRFSTSVASSKRNRQASTVQDHPRISTLFLLSSFVGIGWHHFVCSDSEPHLGVSSSNWSGGAPRTRTVRPCLGHVIGKKSSVTSNFAWHWAWHWAWHSVRWVQV